MDSEEKSGYERRIFRLALLGGLPAVVISIALLVHGHYSGKVQWTLGTLIVATWLVVAAMLRERVVRPLQTLSNLLGALREGDYSIRARGAAREDALGLAFLEANVLGETLRSQRLGAMEASTLLRTVMGEIDVAVYAFDDEHRLRLVNRAGSRVLDAAPEQLLGRVLSHEINNSLAPIKSLAASLQAILDRQPRPPDADDDLRHGLNVIAGRAEALARFMSSYSRLARLPTPQRTALDVEAWVRRVAALETRLPIQVKGGPHVAINADGDQLDQMLINLVRNAVDASLQTQGRVSLGWARRNGMLEVRVEDEGPGIQSGANLFVPFFTTKPEGSGIGLVLSRQIAEAHGGTLILQNRGRTPGTSAICRL